MTVVNDYLCISQLLELIEITVISEMLFPLISVLELKIFKNFIDKYNVF